MTDHLDLRPHRVLREDRTDGSILLRSGYDAEPVVRCTGEWLHRWAKQSPDAVFLAERSGAGWRSVTYSETLEAVHAIASHLLDRGMDETTPILILSGNGVDHGLLTLAAQYVGVPTVPIAEQYSLIPSAHARLRYVVNMVRPKLVFTADAGAYADALSLDVLAEIDALASDPAGGRAMAFEDWLSPVSQDVSAAFDRVGPDTLAKILLTSGSTSDPKGVLTTQRMMCTNQMQILQAHPFVMSQRPKIVDWLPWNHVFGGSYTFNLMLSTGGTLYVDDGKPLKGMFERTLENLSMVPSTLSFNVPVGFAQLVEALKRDHSLRKTYFSELDLIFYAGASLPEDVWRGLEQQAAEAGERVPLIASAHGLTETAPAMLMCHQPADGPGAVGVPVVGCEVKLVPESDGRYDVRVRGEQITKGYFDNPEKTAEAFDEEGFFVTGDGMSFVDENDPNKGLRFEARLSEDFKLMTGTWVRAAALRLEVLAALAPLAVDVVITGHERMAVGALIIPNEAAIAQQGFEVTRDGGAYHAPNLAQVISARLGALGANGSGSASRITCAMIASEPPSMGDGEITAKGNLNFTKLIERRANLVTRLYDPDDPARIAIEE